MTDIRFPGKTKPQGITIVLTAIVMLLLFSASCSKENKDVVEVVYDPETTYTLKTTDVYTLISDSGIVSSRLIADEWYVFGKASEPYWYFPEGFYAEKFDSTFTAEGFVKADTAYYWEKKSLWKLIGSVEVVTLKGDSISSEILFWDQSEELIYTHVYARIVQEDGTVITGTNGFRTTMEMSKYEVYNAGGEFLFNESASADSTQTDSTVVTTSVEAPANPRVRRPTPPPHNPMNFAPSRREIPVLDSLPPDLIEERQRFIENENVPLQTEQIELFEVDSVQPTEEILQVIDEIE